MNIKFNSLFSKKTDWEKRGISFKSLVVAEKQIFKCTRNGYKHENDLFAKCMDLHMNSMGYVFDLLAKGDVEI